MKWHNVQLVFLRELRDQLRDRRTLFVLLALPVLLYLVLGVGMVQMTILFAEQPGTVLVLGADELEGSGLLDGDEFAANWLPDPDDRAKLRVVTDSRRYAPEARERALLAYGAELRRLVGRLAPPDGAQNGSAGSEHPVEFELQRRFAASSVDVLLVVPEGFRSRNLSGHSRQTSTVIGAYDESPDQLLLVQNAANEKSALTFARVKHALDRWQQALVAARLREAELPQDFLQPVGPRMLDLSRPEHRAANLWGRLLPGLLILMLTVGAFYPAVDVCAGEKERGTIETLLICPATRTEIVFGKFLMVLVFSIASALLNLLSMLWTGRSVLSLAGQAAQPLAVSAGAVAGAGLFFFPLAALLSAACLALASSARSTKEGQYYLAPLLAVALGTALGCFLPGVEITPFFALLPLVGPTLWLKALFSATGAEYGSALYAIPVFVSTLLYSGLALRWAVRQFSREDILFRASEQFHLGLWVRDLWRRREVLPSPSAAGWCFACLLVLQVLGPAFLAPWMGGRGDERFLFRGVLLQQGMFIALPALLLGLLFARGFRQTFRISRPPTGTLVGAAALALALHPLILELAAATHWFFPPLPAAMRSVLQNMGEARHPIWVVLLALAVAPAVCEEIAFRGLILSGLSRSGRTTVAALGSGLMFGAIHLVPQQVFTAGLLGGLLGLVALRSGSLLPGIVFHLIFNSLEVLRSRIVESADLAGALGWFAVVDAGGLHYRWPTLLIAAAVAALIIRRIAVPAHASELSTAVRRQPRPAFAVAFPEPCSPSAAPTSNASQPEAASQSSPSVRRAG